MRIFLVFFSTLGALAAFSDTETKIILALFDYFDSDYLDLLDEDLGVSYVLNASYPSKNSILTAVVSAEDVITRLKSFNGMILVAAREDSKSWRNFLKITDKSTMRAAKWILFSSKLDSLDSIYIPFDCQFIHVNMETSLPILKEVYYIEKGGQQYTAHFGYYDPKNGLSTPGNYFYTRRPDFKGHTFSAIIQNAPPYTYVTQFPNGSFELNGYFYEVWRELETRLKFKTHFRLIDDPVRALANGEASFAVLPISQEPKIAKIVAFAESIYEAKIYLFGNRPGSELEWNSYLKPFSTYTWVATLGWMLISSAAMSALYYVAWSQRTSEPEAGHYVFSVSVCVETVFRAVCGQGSDVTPLSISCRLLFLSIYMTALVLTSAFSAALFSLLTIPVSRAPFNTFRQVINQNNYKIGIILESDIYKGIKDLAERFQESDQNKLFKMIEAPEKLPHRVSDALEQVCNRKDYIFMWDLPNVLEILRDMNRTCQEKIMPGGPLLFKENFGFATTLDSPYKELIDLQLLRLKNEGVLRRLLLNTWPPHIPNVQTSWVRVTLADISPILIMFSIGVILGVAILMLEHLNWKFRAKPRNASKAIAERIQSASRLLQNIKNSQVSNWSTKYMDWKRDDPRQHKVHYN